MQVASNAPIYALLMQLATERSEEGFRILLPLPCLSVKKDPKEKTRENGRFLPFFRAHFFSKFRRSIFDIFSSRRIRTTENALFSEFHNECKQHEGLEPATRFQTLSLFCVSHKMFTNSVLQNKSISSPRGFEPAKSRKMCFLKLIHRTCQRTRTRESPKMTC